MRRSSISAAALALKGIALHAAVAPKLQWVQAPGGSGVSTIAAAAQPSAGGIAATMAPAIGLPGNVYRLGVFVPDPATQAARNPNLANFKMPPQVRVRLVMGDVDPSNPNNSVLLSQ
jgi:hypothetical protein